MHGALQPFHEPREFRRRQFRGKALTCGIAPLADDLAQRGQCRCVTTAAIELVNQPDLHVQLADVAELRRDLAQLSRQFPARLPIQFQKRKELAKSPGGNSGTMQRILIATRDVIDLAGERSDPISKRIDRTMVVGQRKEPIVTTL
jgi:hypothetical protein